MGCCESKDDPYTYHFDPPQKSGRDSLLSFSRDPCLLDKNKVRHHITNSSLHYFSEKNEDENIVEKTKAKPTPLIIKEDIILPRSHNRKVSCDLTLPKVTIETFSTVANKPNIVKKDNHINTYLKTLFRLNTVQGGVIQKQLNILKIISCIESLRITQYKIYQS